MTNLFKVGWIEFIIALLMGAPVRLRSGRVFQLRYPRPSAPKFLDPYLFGFDFSKYQGIINFAQVFLYGAKFIILRCSYAITTDQKFLEYIVECLKYFPNATSVYHYYDPTVSPVSQANKVVQVLAPYKNQIKRVWGDFEFYWSGNYESSANWKIYAETIIAAGYEFGVYTRKTWWDSRVGSLASWFGQFPLWAAQYASSLTLIPVGWIKADAWQSGTPAIGTQVGTQSLEVDYDIMDNEFYNKEYGVITPPPGGDMSIWKEATGSITMRTSPEKLDNNHARLDGVIQYVLSRDVLELSETYNGWGHIINIYRNGEKIVIPPDPVWCGLLYTKDTTWRPPTTPPPTTDTTYTATLIDNDTGETWAGILTKQ